MNRPTPRRLSAFDAALEGFSYLFAFGAAPRPHIGLPRMVAISRGCLREEPDIACDVLTDVERDLTLGLDLLGSIVDDYDAGKLPPAEAMTAVRDLTRRLRGRS